MRKVRKWKKIGQKEKTLVKSRNVFEAKLTPLLFCLVAKFLTSCEWGRSSGCTTEGDQNMCVNNQILVFSQEGIPDITTFNQAKGTDVASISATDMVFTGLVDLETT